MKTFDFLIYMSILIFIVNTVVIPSLKNAVNETSYSEDVLEDIVHASSDLCGRVYDKFSDITIDSGCESSKSILERKLKSKTGENPRWSYEIYEKMP